MLTFVFTQVIIIIDLANLLLQTLRSAEFNEKEDLMKKKILNSIILTSLIICSILMCVTLPTNAATKAKSEYFFNLKLNEASTPKFEKTKAGKSNFEKKYYVRQIDSDPDGSNISRRFRYYPVYNKKQVATALSLSINDRSRHNNTYFSGQAVADRKYKLYCKCTGSGHKNVEVGVSGYWTP